MSSPYCCTEQAMKILNNPEQSEAMMMEEVRWQITSKLKIKSLSLVHLPLYVFEEIQFGNELYLSCQFLDHLEWNAHVTVCFICQFLNEAEVLEYIKDFSWIFYTDVGFFLLELHVAREFVF